MPANLQIIRSTLLNGIRLSMQGSYERRAPSLESVPFILDARNSLLEFLEDAPDSGEAWRLLSQAQECLLNYAEAIRCLQKATAIDPPSKKDQKRLANLTSAMKNWQELILSPTDLEELGEFLITAGVDDPSRGKTTVWTERWLLQRGFTSPDAIMSSFADRGAFTDFQILHNVVRG